MSNPGAIEGVRGGVHGEHDVYFHQPARPGMAVKWAAHTYCAKQTPAGVMVSQQFVVRDEHDAPVVEHFWTTIYIGGTIPAGARARPRRPHVPGERTRQLGR